MFDWLFSLSVKEMQLQVYMKLYISFDKLHFSFWLIVFTQIV